MESEFEKNKKTNIDLNTLSLLYEHYRDFLIPFGVIIASILVFLFVVIPQVNFYLKSKDQEKLELTKLQNLQSSIAVLKSMDEAELNNNIENLSAALPLNKDFAGVIGAVSAVSVKTGVSVMDFSLQVGDLQKNTSSASFPSIPVSIKLSGPYSLILNYITEMYKTSPLSETLAFKIEGDAAVVTQSFYYKTFSKTVIDENASLFSLSESEKSLLTTITSWNSSTAFSRSGINLGSLDATPSAQGANSNPF